MHEKSLQRQKGGGPLVISQERIALFVPVINRLSTAGQPVISFLHLFKWDFVCSFFWKDAQATFLRCDPLEGTRDLCFRGEQFCWHPNLPDPARPPRRAPQPDPPVVCLGLGFDKFKLRIRLFVLPKKRSGQLSSVPWCARGTDVLLVNRTVDARPDPPRPARGMSGFWTRLVELSKN